MRTLVQAPKVVAAAAMLAVTIGGCAAAGPAPTAAPASSPAASKATVVPAPSAGVARAFRPGPTMAARRASHTATLLSDGRVLIAGGYTGHGAIASAELLDSPATAFHPAGAMSVPRYFHAAARIEDGVLIVGGIGADTGMEVTDLWLAADASFDAGPTLTTPRGLETATALPDGRVLVIGGLGGSDVRIAGAELMDPEAGTSAKAASLAHPRAWHQATLLRDGRVLVTGGPAEAEAWDPATNTFGPAGALPSARWWGTATPLGDGRVLVIGGFAGDGYPEDRATVAEALLWDPATATFAAAGSLATSRSMHSATLLPDGRVLVVGGVTSTPDRTTLRSSELWDPSTLTFSAGPDLNAARAGHTATVLRDGRVVVIGGDQGADTVLDSTEVWSP